MQEEDEERNRRRGLGLVDHETRSVLADGLSSRLSAGSLAEHRLRVAQDIEAGYPRLLDTTQTVSLMLQLSHALSKGPDDDRVYLDMQGILGDMIKILTEELVEHAREAYPSSG